MLTSLRIKWYVRKLDRRCKRAYVGNDWFTENFRECK